MKAILWLLLVTGATADALTVGSKKFTESVILGEVLSQMLGARHRSGLGGTQVLWKALVRGDVDAYVEYTGTLEKEILPIAGDLASHGIRMSRPLGFNNTYALAMLSNRAEALGIRSLSDLARHPALRLGFTEEFLNRPDGWPLVRARYGMPHGSLRTLDHDIAYKGLVSGDLDVVDAYSTDAEIATYDLRVLTDDRRVFPEYQAVVLYRAGAGAELEGAIARLEGKIDEATMVALNAEAKTPGVTEPMVATGFLARVLKLRPARSRPGRAHRFWAHTRRHLYLVGMAMLIAIVVSLPLGVGAFRYPRLAQAILAGTGLFQTVPALALLVFLIPFLGIGTKPAIFALAVYAMLPIVRNTYTGLKDIPPQLLEVACALGLPPRARLIQIELPLASRAILAGIKTSTVITIGGATLGALIGAGGYGEPILTGIRLDDVAITLEGAVPAAAMALLAQGLFEGLDRWIVHRGLRL